MARATEVAQDGVTLAVHTTGFMTIGFGDGASLTARPELIRRFVDESLLLTVAETAACSDLLWIVSRESCGELDPAGAT